MANGTTLAMMGRLGEREIEMLWIDWHSMKTKGLERTGDVLPFLENVQFDLFSPFDRVCNVMIFH